MSRKAIFSGWSVLWCWRIMVWSSQIESATLSPFIKAFWRVFHGKDVSYQEARTLWKLRRIMSEMVIGRFFSVDSVLVSLAIRTVSPQQRVTEGSRRVARQQPHIEVGATSSRWRAFKSLLSQGHARDPFDSPGHILHRNRGDQGSLNKPFRRQSTIIISWRLLEHAMSVQLL